MEIPFMYIYIYIKNGGLMVLLNRGFKGKRWEYIAEDTPFAKIKYMANPVANPKYFYGFF